MPSIQAFHGLRYDLGQVGSLTDVVAPPYDVIDSEMQTQLYERHPANVVRLILNREEPGDDNPDNRYKRAARFLKVWRQEGVLQREPQAAIYYYQQVFSHLGQEFARSGFMARVRLERFGEGKIFPHEETHSAAKADRLKLISACQANLSQIFGIYPDSENQVDPIFARVVGGVAPWKRPITSASFTGCGRSPTRWRSPNCPRWSTRSQFSSLMAIIVTRQRATTATNWQRAEGCQTIIRPTSS